MLLVSFILRLYWWCFPIIIEFSWYHVFIPTQTNLADFTGNHWVTCFQETAELLLKITADELGQMRDSVSKTRCFFGFFSNTILRPPKDWLKADCSIVFLKWSLFQFEFAIDVLVLDLLNNAILCRKTFVQYCILNVTSYYYYYFFVVLWRGMSVPLIKFSKRQTSRHTFSRFEQRWRHTM